MKQRLLRDANKYTNRKDALLVYLCHLPDLSMFNFEQVTVRNYSTKRKPTSIKIEVGFFT
ncbi:MAG: hypothetical protein LW721_12500 [Flammeovirgaceae bacterium]|jgi:hypothetical protein|nr:hypothetical protein [Flammeovirgaceae bacterium]